MLAPIDNAGRAPAPDGNKSMCRNALLIGVASLSLAACAGKTLPLQSNANLSVVAEDALPAPTRADQSKTGRSYVIGPFDEMTIDVFGIEEMSDRKVQVDGAGDISFPLVGTVTAGGRTPRELETELERMLRAKFVRDPAVSVNLTKTVSQVVTIDGEVTKPGLYPVLGGMTLMRAVATAEGAGEFAKLDDVVVFRESGGQRYAALYNLGAIRRGYYADPTIFAGDVVIVGESRARRMFRDILAAAPLLTTPIIALVQNGGL